MANDDALKTFKIADQAKGAVKNPTKKADKAAAPPSVGFPKIEALVEATTPDWSGFDARMEALAEMQKSGSNKDKLAAKKAHGAYEKTKALLSYLLDTKAKMQGKAP